MRVQIYAISANNPTVWAGNFTLSAKKDSKLNSTLGATGC